MNYLMNLYSTYNAMSSEIGIEDAMGHTLLPIYHSSVNAQIDVTINSNGEFLSAKVLDKENRRTLIPITNDSENRTSGYAAHPLFDKLSYVAGDYKAYVDEKEKSNFDLYMSGLLNWCESSYSNSKIISVYKYLQKKTLISDLIKFGVLYTDESGKLLKKWNTNGVKPEIFSTGIAQSDSFIRFSVETFGEAVSGLYLDKEVQNDYIQYYLSQEAYTDICYVTGEKSRISRLCPGKIRNAGDKGKIISANDTSGLTFRGRLTKPEQVYAISEEVTQKAFSALRFLIEKQGYRNDTLAILTWAVNNTIAPPNPLHDTFDLLFAEDTEEESSVYSSREEFARRFNEYLNGYGNLLLNSDGIAVIALNSAASGKGRLSVTYYRELSGSDFLERIRSWHADTMWYQTKSLGNKKWITYLSAPSPKTIALALYGTKAKGDIVNECIQRILPCIIDGYKLPRDMVMSAIITASNRIAYDPWEWERNLSVACALYRNYFKEENYSMSLERERKTRDYLYGRLLAVADMLEAAALRQSDEKRETNAARYMQRFVDSPYDTWRNLYLSLSPYRTQLGNKAFIYEKEFQQIMDLFNPDDFTSSRRLSGEFLLGYYCQRAAFFEGKKNATETDENN